MHECVLQKDDKGHSFQCFKNKYTKPAILKVFFPCTTVLIKNVLCCFVNCMSVHF